MAWSDSSWRMLRLRPGSCGHPAGPLYPVQEALPMPRRRLLSLAATLSLVPAAIVPPAMAQDEPLAPPDAEPLAEQRCLPSGDGTGVRLTTAEGDIVIGL